MIEQGLLILLATAPSIQAIVPSDAGGTTQVYWELAPKGAKPPYVILSRAATADTQTMQGTTALRGALIQVDCYTDTKAGTTAGYYTCVNLANAVRAVLGNFTGNLQDANATPVTGVLIEKDFAMPYEEGGQAFVFRRMLEFRVWYLEAAMEIDEVIIASGF